ncbi:MAG: DUF1643 domain-containing protein [Solirubrobacterales bacterium]|jgi:hypothetical protein
MDDLRLTPMTDFTTDPPGDLLGRATFAVFNRERSQRYWLIRIWDRARPLLVVVMFNPSDADDERNDPTISALIHFATMWGYGGLLVINLHSHVSSQPSAIRRLQADDVETCPYPNVVAWKEAIGYARDQHLPILLAWGNLGDEPTIKRFASFAHDLPAICLGKTSDGRPKHPMARGLYRIPRDLEPQPFDWSIYDDS